MWGVGAVGVYSFGVVMWELLTGECPWEGMDPSALTDAVGFKARTHTHTRASEQASKRASEHTQPNQHWTSRFGYACRREGGREGRGGEGEGGRGTERGGGLSL